MTRQTALMLCLSLIALQVAAAENGSIVGHAYIMTRGGDAKMAAGKGVWLFPQTTEIVEWVTEHVIKKKDKIVPPKEITPAGYPIVIDADAKGEFEFLNVPPGVYCLTTYFIWEVPSRYGPQYTGGPAYACGVQVRPGKQTKAIVKG